MNALVLGGSPVNTTLCDFLLEKGHEVLLEEDVFALQNFYGQAGAFYATLHACTHAVDFVVLTEPLHAPPPTFGGERACSLYHADKPLFCRDVLPQHAIAFALDVLAPSRLAASVQVLEDAMVLAQKKRCVYVFYRSLRTSYEGGETLFLRARAAGVQFVRYETIRIEPSLLGFCICAVLPGGQQTLEIDAHKLFCDGSSEQSAAYTHAVSVLQLYRDEENRRWDEFYFMEPAYTSRRGVYRLAPGLPQSRLHADLRVIAADVLQNDAPDASQAVAVVDTTRCAFCLTCVRNCPHAALYPAENARHIACHEIACEGCGNCVSVCPGKALQLKEVALGERTPFYLVGEGGTPAHTLVFCCQHSGVFALPKALALMPNHVPVHHLTPQQVPCAGSVGADEIISALTQYDKVLLLGCMQDACRHFVGNRRVKSRCHALKLQLEALGLPASRLQVLHTSHAQAGVLCDDLTDFFTK